MSRGLKPKRIEKLVKMGRLIPIVAQEKDGKPYLAGYSRKPTSRKRYQRFLLPKETSTDTTNLIQTVVEPNGQPEVVQLFDSKGGEADVN